MVELEEDKSSWDPTVDVETSFVKVRFNRVVLNDAGESCTSLMMGEGPLFCDVMVAWLMISVPTEVGDIKSDLQRHIALIKQKRFNYSRTIHVVDKIPIPI